MTTRCHRDSRVSTRYGGWVQAAFPRDRVLREVDPPKCHLVILNDEVSPSEWPRAMAP